ncbi:MAG: putative quinol monooxygenase [Methanobacterium sp.]
MIIVNATITVKPGERDNIILKSNDLIELTRLEAGCISYKLFKSTEDDNVLMMIEQWENFEDLESHMQTEHFLAYVEDIEDMINKNIDIAVYSADKI